jgi:hypothetical protein
MPENDISQKPLVRTCVSKYTKMFQYKGELECVCCSMLKNLKGPVKIKGRVNIFLNIWSTCPNQGLLIDITSKHL